MPRPKRKLPKPQVPKPEVEQVERCWYDSLGNKRRWLDKDNPALWVDQDTGREPDWMD